MVRVHHQLRLVVGAPEAEGHEPGVQEARVIRVLDVLLHQLPVARNALPVVAEDLQLATVEQAVEVVQHRRAEEVLEGLDIRIERGEDDAAAGRHPELVEAVLLELEVGRHAAVDLAFLAHAAAKRHALQVALERIVPLVVRAGEIAPVALALAAEAHAAVGADVLDDVDSAFEVAGQDHRALADDAEAEVAGVRDLGLEADVAPVLAVEEALQLEAVQRLAGVAHERDAAGALVLPGQLAGEDGGGCGSVHRGLSAVVDGPTLPQSPSGALDRVQPQVATSPARVSGSRRMRGPPSRATALTTAGASGGTPGSPTPVGAAVLGTMCTSTAGISWIRSDR